MVYSKEGRGEGGRGKKTKGRKEGVVEKFGTLCPKFDFLIFLK
jgi:hypothetical protein